jgi:hypothetical protein
MRCGYGGSRCRTSSSQAEGALLAVMFRPLPLRADFDVGDDHADHLFNCHSVWRAPSEMRRQILVAAAQTGHDADADTLFERLIVHTLG